MRHEIPCVVCQGNHVLIVDAADGLVSGDLGRQMKVRGWQPYADGAICPSCASRGPGPNPPPKAKKETK